MVSQERRTRRFLVGQLGAGRGQVREAAFEAAVADVLAGRTVKGEWEDKEGRKHQLSSLTSALRRGRATASLMASQRTAAIS
jgi:hypothetical protein